MSALFDVPCPDCGRRLEVAADGHLQCRGCRQTYQLRMGHLYPSGRQRSTRRPAASAEATTASQS
jgi:tRNA(Ile2) C34 agmatinyltransferase TiaS